MLDKNVIDEEVEFRDVIKEIVAKDQDNALELEERILNRMKAKALSKGWDKPSGAKRAPLTLLTGLK